MGHPAYCLNGVLTEKGFSPPQAVPLERLRLR
jgi:hypothetical protein